MKYYECENGSLHFGDVMSEIGKLPDKSVNCVITSPPYWQLRDYGYPEQWGLEPTFQEYLEHLWSLMDETWRVLKDDGTVFINLGDSYYGSGHGSWSKYDTGEIDNKDEYYGKGRNSSPKTEWDYSKMKAKCLLLIPHRFAIGCIDRGWIMRNDIIWAKGNGMPESVTDRFSKKHEYIFFMVKSQKYYFDLDGVRDKTITGNHRVDIITTKGSGGAGCGMDIGRAKELNEKGCFTMKNNPNGKNPGSVSDFWDIPTKPSKKKHYATYNTQLIDKPIIAGCPEGGVILDPFNGTGTTTIRAEQLNRKWIGIDGSAEYSKIAKESMESERSQLTLDL